MKQEYYLCFQFQNIMKMESKEYFEKVMQDYNQHRNGRSLRKYCKDEAIDYDWVIKFKKTYPVRSTEKEEPAEGFVPLAVTEEPVPALDVGDTSVNLSKISLTDAGISLV